MKTQIILLAAAIAALSATAHAHVTVAPGQAAPGTTVAAGFHIGHGCSGQPTTSLKVEIPKEIAMAHPMESRGWTLTIQKSWGRIKSVTWTVNAPDVEPDVFEVHVELPKKAGPVYFPALQTCGQTTVPWNDRPDAAGKTGPHPAPKILVTDQPMAAAPAQAMDPAMKH